MMEGIKLTALKMAFQKSLDHNLHLRTQQDKGVDFYNWYLAIETSSKHSRRLDKEITQEIKRNQLKK